MHEVADKLDVGDGVIAPTVKSTPTVTRSVSDIVHVITRQYDKGTVVQNAIRSVATHVKTANFDVTAIATESSA